MSGYSYGEVKSNERTYRACMLDRRDISVGRKDEKEAWDEPKRILSLLHYDLSRIKKSSIFTHEREAFDR